MELPAVTAQRLEQQMENLQKEMSASREQMA